VELDLSFSKGSTEEDESSFRLTMKLMFKRITLLLSISMHDS